MREAYFILLQPCFNKFHSFRRRTFSFFNQLIATVKENLFILQSAHRHSEGEPFSFFYKESSEGEPFSFFYKESSEGEPFSFFYKEFTLEEGCFFYKKEKLWPREAARTSCSCVKENTLIDQ